MKKHIKILSQITCIGLLLILGGCESAFKPPPYSYEAWKKPGVSMLDVKKTMIECGYPNPEGTGMQDMAKEEVALIHLCMENDGFVYKTSRGIRKYCESYQWSSSLKSCQPGAVIPKPSKEHRLNSKFCRVYLDLDYCLKNAPYPDRCSSTDFKNPPKECLP